jgi:hypothetical protein
MVCSLPSVVIGLDEVLMKHRYACFTKERQERCYGDEERY